jgi:hypothetical protein
MRLLLEEVERVTSEARSLYQEALLRAYKEAYEVRVKVSTRMKEEGWVESICLPFHQEGEDHHGHWYLLPPGTTLPSNHTDCYWRPEEGNYYDLSDHSSLHLGWPPDIGYPDLDG